MEYYVQVDIPKIIKVRAATPEEAIDGALKFLKYPDSMPYRAQIIEEIEAATDAITPPEEEPTRSEEAPPPPSES